MILFTSSSFKILVLFLFDMSYYSVPQSTEISNIIFIERDSFVKIMTNTVTYHKNIFYVDTVFGINQLC